MSGLRLNISLKVLFIEQLIDLIIHAYVIDLRKINCGTKLTANITR